MSRLAVLSDIHGNIDALEAVILCSKDLAVDHFLILGDMVGYYYGNIEVIERLQELPATVISGNHERLFLDCLTSNSSRVEYRRRYGNSFEMSVNHFGGEHISWLKKLPEHLHLKIDDKFFELYHGSPWDSTAYIYPDAQRDILARCIRDQINFTLVGHTHHALIKRIASHQMLINPGSVGQARDISGLASWCLIDNITNEIVYHRTPYNMGKLLQQIRQYDPEKKYLKNVLLRASI